MLLILAGTRLSLKTGVKIQKTKMIIAYSLFKSRFWHHLGVQILGTKTLDLKAIKVMSRFIYSKMIKVNMRL